MKEKWTKDIRERLDGHRMKEPDGLWEDISNALKNEYGNGQAAKSRKTRFAYLVTRMAAAVAVIAVIFVCIQILDTEYSREKVATLTEESTATTKAAKETSRHGKGIINKSLAIVNGATDITRHVSPTLLYDNATGNVDDMEELTYSETQTEIKEDTNDTPTTTEERPKTKDTYRKHTDTEVPPIVLQAHKKAPRGKNVKGHNGIELGITASNGIVSESDNGGGYVHTLYAFAPAMNDADNILIQKASYSNKEKASKHDLPLKLGLNVRYNINGKWSVESGVTYTWLRSTFKENGELQYKKSVQRLHYIGIPVSVAYSLWNIGRLNVYVSAGGEVSKCISGKVETEATIYETSDGENTKNNTERPWLFSVNAAAGIQFSVVNGLSLYAEPGIGYYFDNNSSIETYYSEHPFSPNIKVGLRLQLP